MWHQVICTDRLIPARYDAYTIGPIVLIRPHQMRNRGLLEHERVHVRQFWRTLGLIGLGRLISKRYRLACEVEAYREQLKWTGMHQATVYAYYLCRNYGLRITHEQAMKELTK
jgi:hypothetical protein